MNDNFYLFFIYLVKTLITAILGVAWIAGFVIAKGFWSTLFGWIPFYAWYLVLERIMFYYNFI